MKRIKPVLPLLLLVLIGVTLYASGALDFLRPENLLAQQARLTGLIDASPWLARIAFVGLVTLSVATGVPGSIVLILAGGFLFGVVQGTVLSTIGLLLGSLLLFMASRHAFRSGKRQPPALAVRLRDGYHLNPLSYTLFLRLVPVFPFGAVTIALAWLRCPVWMFLLASGIGGVIMLVFETAIGAGLASHLAKGKALSFSLLMDPNIGIPLVCLAMLALLPVAFNHYRARRRRKLVLRENNDQRL
ncbi:MAG: VTT domain-containing protein [Rhodanobacteraceae bacterium]